MFGKIYLLFKKKVVIFPYCRPLPPPLSLSLWFAPSVTHPDHLSPPRLAAAQQSSPATLTSNDCLLWHNSFLILSYFLHKSPYIFFYLTYATKRLHTAFLFLFYFTKNNIKKNGTKFFPTRIHKVNPSNRISTKHV